ncbi:NADH:flavin oxidoreductase/NADH oxidase [Trametes maxima]|nr:NADH:flavin oxidoreductase/NADH oxidase [Trametes maxima]
MSSANTPALFQPIQVGDVKLGHRVVLAPLTRNRADNAHVHTDVGVEYYVQRGSVRGTMLISEGTFIAPQAGGITNVPGIWNDAQIAAWKKITDAVHAKGSFIYLQLWALGRAARPAALKEEDPSYPYISASDVPLSTSPGDIPRPLTKDEIKQYVQWYATAAKNSIKAGFDGVEIHGANGYLVDQFTQDVSNKRTDEYGGSIENRARFALEVVDAVVAAIGPTKTGIRFSPWGAYQDMRMENPVPQFSYIIEKLKEKHSDLAFIHLVSPGAAGGKPPQNGEDKDFIHKLWKPRPLITTGGYTRDDALKIAEETGQIIGFGLAFLANPDLPFRLQHNLPLNKPDPETFYFPRSSGKGYTTYPFSEEFLKTQ